MNHCFTILCGYLSFIPPFQIISMRKAHRLNVPDVNNLRVTSF